MYKPSDVKNKLYLNEIDFVTHASKLIKHCKYPAYNSIKYKKNLII